MTALTRTAAVLLFLFAAAAFSRAADATPAATDEKLGWPGTIHILSGPPGGQWDALGMEMEKLLDQADIPAKNKIGGGVENLRKVGENEADIGFTLYSFLGAAGAGEKELPAVNLDNAVLLANLYPQVLYIIVRQEVADRHNLKTLGDLLKIKDPIRFSTLPKGTGSEFIFNMLLKSAYRTSYDQLENQGWNVEFQSYAKITERFLDGQLDVCAYTAGPGTYLIPALEEKHLDAVLLPVDEDMLNLMTHQFMTITYVIEKGDYESVDEDVLTLGDYSCLIVRSDIPNDLVRRINEILWKNKEPLSAITKDMKHFSPRYAVSGQSTVHPGSLEFWTSPEMTALKEASGK